MSSILIFGSGFVGGATGRGLAKHGNDVTFLDVSQEKVDALRAESYSSELVEDYNSTAWDIAMITVPTPTLRHKISLEYIKKAADSIGQLIKNHPGYPVVVVRSTVPPGTTETVVKPIIEKISGKKLGEGFGLAMQPEYLRQVTADSDFERPWHVFIGKLDNRGADVVTKLYEPFNAPIEHGTASEAEMQKYVHNLFNAVKISFFNEMRAVCKAESLDAQKIFQSVAQSCEGIWNGMYGLRDYGPFDGECLPKDTQAFLDWSVQHGYKTIVLDAVIKQNKLYAAELQAAKRPVIVEQPEAERQDARVNLEPANA